MHEKSYRGYISEVLRLAGENLAILTGGMYIKSKWVDLSDEKREDSRSPDEIALDIISRAGLSLSGDTK